MIHKEIRDSVTVLRMEHGKVNALDSELFAALHQALQETAGSPAKAVVLTGSGIAFSAGVDLFRLLQGGIDYLLSFVSVLVKGLEELFFYPKPVVAAVNGHAIAGGCILTCACDYRVMTQGPATIGVTELMVGVPYPASALEIMRFAVAPQHLQEIVYTGRTYSPEEALQRGLIDEIVAHDNVVDRAVQVAAAIGSIPSEAFQITKRRLREPVRTYLRMLPDEEEQVVNAWCSPETHRVIREYLDRTIGKRS